MVVDGSIAHYGRYTVDDGGKTLTLHIESSTFKRAENGDRAVVAL